MFSGDDRDCVARIEVPLVGPARDCTCPPTTAICTSPVCPRRAIVPPGIRCPGFVTDPANDRPVCEFAA
jgi:hypothetical protein